MNANNKTSCLPACLIGIWHVPMMETDEMHTMNSAELAAAVNDPSEVKSDHVSDDASMANFLLYEKPLLPGKGVLYVYRPPEEKDILIEEIERLLATQFAWTSLNFVSEEFFPEEMSKSGFIQRLVTTNPH